MVNSTSRICRHKVSAPGRRGSKLARNEDEGTAKKDTANQKPLGRFIYWVCMGFKPALGRCRMAGVNPVVVGPQDVAYGAQEAMVASGNDYSWQTLQGGQLTNGRGTVFAPGTSPCMALQWWKTKWTRTKTKWSRGVAEMPLPDGLRHRPRARQAQRPATWQLPV